MRGSAGEHSEADGGMYDVSNRERMGLTEFQVPPVTQLNQISGYLLVISLSDPERCLTGSRVVNYRWKTVYRYLPLGSIKRLYGLEVLIFAWVSNAKWTTFAKISVTYRYNLFTVVRAFLNNANDIFAGLGYDPNLCSRSRVTVPIIRIKPLTNSLKDYFFFLTSFNTASSATPPITLCQRMMGSNPRQLWLRHWLSDDITQPLG